jgi:hypothetical protein
MAGGPSHVGRQGLESEGPGEVCHDRVRVGAHRGGDFGDHPVGGGDDEQVNAFGCRGGIVVATEGWLDEPAAAAQCRCQRTAGPSGPDDPYPSHGDRRQGTGRPSGPILTTPSDPLPAGLEPLNPALAVTGGQPTPPPGGIAPRRGGWWWRGTWYQHQNLRDDRAEAFSSLVRAGVHSYSYVARATTPGTFVVPPAKAEEMYQPETFGRSSSAKVIVE